MSINNAIRTLSKRSLLIIDLFVIITALIIGMWQISFFHNIMKWDILDINLPWRYFTSECLRNGELPLWNPFITTGFPQTADPMTWYPVSWILGLLFGNNLITLQYEYIFHLLLGAIGVYFLGRLLNLNRKTNLMVSISFMFSGLFISNAQHFGWVVGAAWFPFTIYFYVKFCKNNDLLSGLLFVISFYCMLSGGYPAFFIITAYILLGIFICYLYKKIKDHSYSVKFILSNALILTLFLILSSVVLISSFELSNYLTRADKFTVGFAQSYPLPYQGLISFLLPYATTGNVNFYGNDFSMVNCYIGITILIFVFYAISIKNKFAISFFLIGLFLLSAALADIFPIRKALYYLPFMNTFRFPTVFRFFAYAFFIIAGGIGYNHFVTRHERDKKLLISIFVFAAILLFFVIYNSFLIEPWKFKLLLSFNFGAFDKQATIHERIFFQGIIQLSLIGFILFCYYAVSRKTFHFVLFIILVVDMVVAIQLNLYHTVIHHDKPGPTQASLALLPKGFPKPDLHEDVIDNTEQSNPNIPNLWRNMNIFYKKTTAEGYTPYYLKTLQVSVKSGTYYPVLKNPVVFLSDRLFKDNIIDSSSYDTLSFKKIKVLSFSPNQIELKVNTNHRQILTYLQNIYPGWQVSINGNPQKMTVTNYTFMSVYLKTGVNRVIFEYRPGRILICFYISLATFILVILSVIVIAIKQKREAKS